MKRVVVVFFLWTSAFLAIGVVAGALPAEPAPLAAPAATTLRMRGTIGRYDAASRVLSLNTADGTLQLSLAPMVRVRQGGHDIDATALEELSGYRAAVRYTESGGTRTAESIHVFGRNERTER